MNWSVVLIVAGIAVATVGFLLRNALVAAAGIALVLAGLLVRVLA